MPRQRAPIHGSLRSALGYDDSTSDDEIYEVLRAQRSMLPKPCWEIKYCPYGPLVEDFPLLPTILASAEDHNDYLRGCLASGILGSGEPLDDARRSMFEERLAQFDASEHPETIPSDLAEMRCSVFGHLCPVYFAAESFTETDEPRRIGRSSIPFAVKMRVARRDNNTCQACGETLLDDQIEFDHIIPVSRGGSSEEHNLRVTCRSCNRRKGPRVGA